MIRSPLTNINKPLSSGSGARKTYPLKPKMNGYHLSRSIKRIYDIKVIIMIGRYQSDCLKMMAAQWVDGWLFKPFGLDDMRARLQGLGLLKD